MYKTGVDRKNGDLTVIHPGATKYQANDGVVVINLAKYILRPMTEEDIKRANAKPSSGKLKQVYMQGDWICTLHAKCGKSNHPEFVKVCSNSGRNTGNLRRHVDSHHAREVEAIVRMIEEYSMEEVEAKILAHLKGLVPPTGDLDGFVKRVSMKESLDKEIACLVFWLDAQIAFTQLDNPLFKQFVSMMNDSELPSSTTMMKLLTPIYMSCVQQMCDFFEKCPSFVATYDGWSKLGKKFLSQSYHVIRPLDFEYQIMLLDLIPFFGPQYAVNYASTLQARQEHWTGRLKNNPIAAAAVADAESKGQAGGKLLYGEFDMERCQNHRLKKVYEVGEATSDAYKKDFEAIAALASHLAVEGNVRSMLTIHQVTHGLAECSMVLFNDTRWNGRYRVVERALELKGELMDVFENLPKVAELRRNNPDFLKKEYFLRMSDYLTFLELMNQMSELFQTQEYPTGCLVALCLHHLHNRLKVIAGNRGDSPWVKDFKEKFSAALSQHMSDAILNKRNNFLKAACLHPAVAKVLRAFVKDDVLQECFESILEDAVALKDGKFSASLREALQDYWKKTVDASQLKYGDQVADIDLLDIMKTGKYGGVNHLEFWKQVAGKYDLEDDNDSLLTEENRDVLALLLPVAAMLLAIPAGESFDETVFTSSGETLTKKRNSLSVTTIEQVTVVRMFIRRFKWSLTKFKKWAKKVVQEYRKKEEAKQQAETASIVIE